MEIAIPFPTPAGADHGSEHDAERAAISRVRGGDLSAIDVLYHNHAGQLLRLATGICGNRADAEDVVHDVFVDLPRALASFREPHRLDAWLRTLVIRRATDRHRASTRRREVTIESARDQGATPIGRDFVVEWRVQEAIASLPFPLRAVFVLRATDGLSHAEIATLLGIRAGTSEVRYFRAVRALRALLGDIQ